MAAITIPSTSHAEPTPEDYYFTTTPLSRLHSGARSYIDAMKQYQIEATTTCTALLQTEGQAAYTECLNKAGRRVEASKKNYVAKAVKDCSSAGYQNCIHARISAIVVQIEGSTSGSAVVVGDDGKDYLLATSKHVVDSIRDKEKADVIWNGKTISTFSASNIWKSKDYDIALIRAGSKEVLPTPALALEKISLIGKEVIVTGFPIDGDLSNKSGRLLRSSKGSIATQASPDSAPDGYALGYTAPTLGGMSGGGVFVTTTCKNIGLPTPVPMVVGIHGRAERSEAKGDTGFNFAIPISTIKGYKDLDTYLISAKHRANFGCPDGAGSEIRTFFD